MISEKFLKKRNPLKTGMYVHKIRVMTCCVTRCMCQHLAFCALQQHLFVCVLMSGRKITVTNEHQIKGLYWELLMVGINITYINLHSLRYSYMYLLYHSLQLWLFINYMYGFIYCVISIHYPMAMVLVCLIVIIILSLMQTIIFFIANICNYTVYLLLLCKTLS